MMVEISSSIGLAPLLLLGAALGAFAAPLEGRTFRRSVEVQAHRGGLGLRPESTLYAFAYALELGVDVLEMDVVFTKDGIPVIWHDHQVSELKCKDTVTGTEGYVGKYIANLTLAEVKTLDCGSLQLASYKQAKLVPGATIQTLEEVLDLVDCYGDRKVEINLETKLDPLRPNETLPLETYNTALIPILKKHNFLHRSYIQSFDWRTLIAIKRSTPSVRTVALLDYSTVISEDRGVSGYPWLGGIDLEKDFKGDWVKAAKSIGASVLSPSHGEPNSLGVNGVGYQPFTTKEVVERAHKLGMQVVPWTVDDESTIDALISYGVDGIISNYPARVKYVAKDRGYSVGSPSRPSRPRCLVGGGAF